MTVVSVIIPVFNGAAGIARTVESALAQRFGGFEVVVVDDGSTDRTPAILSEFGARIRVVRQANRGPAAARNAGCRVATGSVFAFLDADDEWLEQKLAKTVPLLERQRETVLIFSDAIAVDHAGRVIAESYVTPATAHAPSRAEILTQWWPILPSTAVIRRDAFERCGGFVEEFRGAAYEDPFFWLTMRDQGPFAYVPERLVHYRTDSALKRMEKYLPAQEIFIRRVQERYGAAARGLIRSTRGAYATALSHEGLLAIRAGDRVGARRYFVRALRHRPIDLRSTLRLLRTFLPVRLARALSGRTGRPHSRA